MDTPKPRDPKARMRAPTKVHIRVRTLTKVSERGHDHIETQLKARRRLHQGLGNNDGNESKTIRKARTICGEDRRRLNQLVAVVSSQQSGSRRLSGRSGGHYCRGSSSSSSMVTTSHGSEVEDRDSDFEAEGSIRSYRSRHGTEKLRRRMSWRWFEKGLLVRFGSSEYEDANEDMSKLRQKGAFREYLGEFERLMNTLPHWHPSALLECIHGRVKRGDCRRVADVEAEGFANLYRARKEEGRATAACMESKGRFSSVRLQNRNWRSGCSGIKVMLIELVEEDEGKAVEEPLTEETEYISIHALTGQVNNKTMRFSGRIGRHKVQVLKGQLCKPEFHRPTGGSAIKVSRDRAIALCGAGSQRQVVEVVLGVPWLEQLGPTLTDYKEVTMEFKTEGKRHNLRGAVSEGTRAVEARSVV
ncbi:hypothetical protein CRG98_006695 [Punica granatum]|uniref:Retrotransposon gag domain-containing protein n=1 Tax=Punica granatum TaxID=22663 RepID=A0A2I0KX02_PUNGR|nr:hypothetical protein CRG98_006695 [Punica granatum]